MRRWTGRAAFVVLAAAAAILGIVGFIAGDLTFYVVAIVPVIRADGPWGVAAIICALTAFAALLFDLRSTFAWDGRSRDDVSAGGVIFIGPFPIMFGTDRRAIDVAIAIAIACMAALILFLLLQ